MVLVPLPTETLGLQQNAGLLKEAGTSLLSVRDVNPTTTLKTIAHANNPPLLPHLTEPNALHKEPWEAEALVARNALWEVLGAEEEGKWGKG